MTNTTVWAICAYKHCPIADTVRGTEGDAIHEFLERRNKNREHNETWEDACSVWGFTCERFLLVSNPENKGE